MSYWALKKNPARPQRVAFTHRARRFICLRIRRPAFGFPISARRPCHAVVLRTSPLEQRIRTRVDYAFHGPRTDAPRRRPHSNCSNHARPFEVLGIEFTPIVETRAIPATCSDFGSRISPNCTGTLNGNSRHFDGAFMRAFDTLGGSTPFDSALTRRHFCSMRRSR